MRLACMLEIGPSGTRKRYAVNGEPVRYLRYLGRLRVVTFAPADVTLAAGAPSVRRAFLNAALAQESTAYHEALIAYTRSLEQKNALLRGAVPWDPGLLDVYDAQLAAAGETIAARRAAFAEDIAAPAAAAYARVAPADPRLGSATSRTRLPASLAGALAAARGAERVRRRALCGPHRDDLAVSLGGRPIAGFGSQAQLRSAALALKLAELEAGAASAGEAPLALFDDVLSELDPARQRELVELLGERGQAFLTTAGPVPAGRHARFEVRAATVRRVA